MKLYHKWLILISIFFGLSTAVLQGQDFKSIEPKKMQKDLTELLRIIEAHPDPFTHISEEAFMQRYEETRASCNTTHSIPEFYRKVAGLVALIRDGHTSVHMPEDWLLDLRKKYGGFPYEMYLDNDDRLYVLKNQHSGVIRPGSKVIAINGMATDSFIRAVDPMISHECKPFRNTILDGSFELYLYLIFGKSDSTLLTCVLEDTLTTVARNVEYKKWKETEKDSRDLAEKQIDKGEPYRYEKIDKGVGMIQIFSFSVPDLAYYDLFLSKTFTKIRKDSIHSLIIDVRGNFGGWPKVASRMFHYLTNKHFKTMAMSSLKVSKAYRHNMLERNPGLRGLNINFRLPSQHFVDINSVLHGTLGSFVIEDQAFNEEPIIEANEFRGDVYLLTNRDSYSAASSFASTFQCYGMGVLIGQETGGTKIFRANAMYELLPSSKLRVRISTTKLFTACFNEEMEGIKPTIAYTPSILELVSGLDTQLMFARKVIKKMQAGKVKN